MGKKTVEFTEEEASVIQFAIVECEQLWKKEGNHWVPKDEVTQRILDKIASLWEDEEEDE